jgi:hypothetical protein
MGTPGALICAWVDVAAEDRSAFREFHDREHMFERLDIPGFRRGRRFRAIEATSDFLILYEVDDLSTLESPAYLARLNAPTPWTLQSISKVKKSRRATLTLDFSRGRARGGCLLAVRYAAGGIRWQQGLRSLADDLTQHAGVLAVHAGVIDERTSNLETTERNAGNPDAWSRQTAEQILMIEATSSETLRELRDHVLSKSTLHAGNPTKLIDSGIYALEICISG